MSQPENVRRVAEQILEAFQAGTVPAACAQIFLRHTPDDARPCARWSWRNQLLAALLGHHDARGFRQWQEVGRHVRKGERAFYILAPSLRRAEPKDDEPQDEPEFVVTGFVCVPVFGYAQTEGDPLPGAEEEAAFLSALPLVEVARSWGLRVGTFAAQGTGRLGYYRPGEAIAVGVENLSTWAHELLHYAAFRIMPIRGPLCPIALGFGAEPGIGIIKATRGRPTRRRWIGSAQASRRRGRYATKRPLSSQGRRAGTSRWSPWTRVPARVQ